jgi:hypothetical protein
MSKTGDTWAAVFSNKLSFHADFNGRRYCKQIVFLEKPFIAQPFFSAPKLG